MMAAHNTLVEFASKLELAMGLVMGREFSFLRVREERPLLRSSSFSFFQPQHQFVVG